MQQVWTVVETKINSQVPARTLWRYQVYSCTRVTILTCMDSLSVQGSDPVQGCLHKGAYAGKLT